MTKPHGAEADRARARKGRMVALVIAGAGLAALFAPYLVAWVGLPLRYEFLIYLAAMAAFLWAMVLTWQLWKSREE